MNWKQTLMLAGIATALTLTTDSALAQQDRPNRQDRGNRGNFDPEQMRARMMERVKEQLEIKSDDEWKIIQPRIEKVMTARRDTFAGGLGRMLMGPPPGRGGDNNAPDQGRRRGFGAPANPEAEALQKAIEAKASTEEIKAKMAKLRESRKEREAKLAQAQEELRKVLNLRQEATAVLNGWLD